MVSALQGTVYHLTFSSPGQTFEETNSERKFEFHEFYIKQY